MAKRLIILSFLVFTILFTKGNPIGKIDSSVFHQKLNALVENPKLIRPDHIFFGSNFIWLDTCAYFNPPGTLHLFKISKNDSSLNVKRLDHSIYHGFNFNNRLFYYNNKVYSFGGAGLFNFFFGLTYFDDKSKEWWYQNIKNLPVNKNQFRFGWLYENTFYLFFNASTIEGNFIAKFGKIDLLTWQFEELNTIEDANNHLAFILKIESIIDENKNLFIFKAQKVIYFFDKVTGEEKTTDQAIKMRVDYPYQPRLSEDTLWYYLQSSTELKKVAISNLNFKYRLKVFDFYPLQENQESDNNASVWMLSLLLLFVPFTIWGIKKKRKVTSYQDDLLNKLSQQNGKEITRDELDKIFEIDKKPVDSAKTLRSKMIGEINAKKANAIERVSNPEDRRSYLYRINV